MMQRGGGEGGLMMLNVLQTRPPRSAALSLF